MLSCTQRSTQLERSITVHQYAHFDNNPCLVNGHAIRRIENYLACTSTYAYLQGRNISLTTHIVVYRTDTEKCIDRYVDAKFSNGWAQADSDNAENIISCTGYVIKYAECPVLWCSKLHT